MKVHLDNVNLGSNSGPNTFAQRLFKELVNRNVTVVDSGKDADVSLVFIEPSGKPLAKKVVQRLDGIWFKPNEFEAKNVQIKNLYQRADAVVWQSEFDFGMTTRWWGHPRHGQIIHNGISSERQNATSEALLHIRKCHQHVFVASSNWHPQKRLRSNIELFFHLRKTSCPDSCLIVMGANPDCWVPSPQVMYTGALSHQDCLAVFSVADWMFHLAWLDHCPNVVIEALSVGVPVVCSDSGGTKELVGGHGLVLKERQEYGYELADYDTPPSIDVTQLETLPEKSSLGPHIDINMSTVAQKYIELFRSIL